jgi:DNA topoisomerase IB
VADLVYTSDEDPGITRKGAGTGFYYLYPDGAKVERAEELERINALAIPPAYRGVWICLNPLGHLQATARDDRERKQYRYHPDWVTRRQEKKFARLASLGRDLPRLRRKVRRDLRDFEAEKQQTVAAAVRLLDRAGLRVGNEGYLQRNKTRGISTLAKENVDLDEEEAETIHLHFTGKAGSEVDVTLRDALLEKALAECHELPGQRLFSYRDQAGNVQNIDSSDINEYLTGICTEECSAKNLRTWRASVLALEYLMRLETPEKPEAETREAVRHAAELLNNTYATCREYYVHPWVPQAWQDCGEEGFERFEPLPEIRELSRAERLLLKIIESD